MLRVIVRRQKKDPLNGLETDWLETVDIVSETLEKILMGGGHSENGYDYRQVVDVEVIQGSRQCNHS